MFIVFLMMLLGIGVGIGLRPVPIVKETGRLVTLFIFFLLFLLGLAVGQDERIISNLGSLGLQAVLITTGAILGSVVLVKILYHLYFKQDER